MPALSRHGDGAGCHYQAGSSHYDERLCGLPQGAPCVIRLSYVSRAGTVEWKSAMKNDRKSSLSRPATASAADQGVGPTSFT